MNRLGDNCTGELARLPVDMAGFFLAPTALHPGYQPVVGSHHIRVLFCWYESSRARSLGNLTELY